MVLIEFPAPMTFISLAIKLCCCQTMKLTSRVSHVFIWAQLNLQTSDVIGCSACGDGVCASILSLITLHGVHSHRKFHFYCGHIFCMHDFGSSPCATIACVSRSKPIKIAISLLLAEYELAPATHAVSDVNPKQLIICPCTCSCVLLTPLFLKLACAHESLGTKCVLAPRFISVLGYFWHLEVLVRTRRRWMNQLKKISACSRNKLCKMSYLFMKFGIASRLLMHYNMYVAR